MELSIIYPYECNNGHYFEVIKHHSQSGTDELCPECGGLAQMVFTAPNLNTSVCHEEPEYNPAFGCVIKNKKQRNELAKIKGLVEVGNEKTSTIHKEHDTIYNNKMNKDYED